MKVFDDIEKPKKGDIMLAARMHGYRQPLVLEEVNIPEISSDQVLVRVGGAGWARSSYGRVWR